MKYVVECLVAFEQTHDLGPVTNICVGDWLNWTGRFPRELPSTRVSIRHYVVGERITFASLAAETAFLQCHPGKFRRV